MCQLCPDSDQPTTCLRVQQNFEIFLIPYRDRADCRDHPCQAVMHKKDPMRDSAFFYSFLFFLSFIFVYFFRDQCLPWLLMISTITALIVLVKLIKIEQYSILGKGIISFVVGFPIGLKTASSVIKNCFFQICLFVFFSCYFPVCLSVYL